MNMDSNSIKRTWAAIDIIIADAKSDRLKLGEHFQRLQTLYSNKSADIRRSGVGTFEQELTKRDLKPRTVREWVSDYEAHRTGAATSAEKRKALRQLKPPADALTEFATLLPATALKAAYREAAKIFHPDRGGSKRKMQQLNNAWARIKTHYEQTLGN
jgi:hypothetical protein